MQAMSEGMGMMRGMSGGMMGAGQASGTAQSMMDCMPMMGEMGQRMEMMEMMMDQMLKHESARGRRCRAWGSPDSLIALTGTSACSHFSGS